MGKSRAEVKKLASEGQLTSKLIFDAFNGSTEKINQKFEQMPISFGGAMQQMENAFMKFVDEQNRTLGITENLAAGVSFLAQNFEYLAGVLLAIAAGNGAKFISTLVLARVETHRQAQASLIAAKATQTQAAAELAAAQAKMNLLNSEMQLVRTKKARAAIEAKMAQQAQVITGLINAEAVAMNNLAAASQRASIASSAAAGAKNLLSGALGLIGGPAGAATIAAGALFYFSQKAQEAKEAALDTESANNRLKESYDGLSESALTLKIFEQIQAMENYGEQISKVQAEISQIQTSAWQFGLELSESSKQDLEKLNAELEKIRENKNIDLSVLTNQLTALGGVFLSNGKSIDDFRTKMKNLGVDANTADSVIAGLSNTIKQQKEAAQGGV
ncbi:phage tail protein, partial [Glaesserella parasuis]|nr:phage tail protein [Glaesserella parasuis]